MKTLITAAVLVLAASNIAFGIPIDCPASITPSNTIGSANLGSTFTTCGNVLVASGIATISSTSGFEPASMLNPYLGVDPLISAGGIVATDGSALQFQFTAPAGSSITFDFLSSFDPDVNAFTFAVLDGAITTLEESNQISGLVLAPFTLTIPTGGSHTLSFGVANGGFLPDATTDPNLTLTNVVLNDVPEPATLSLLGLGLAFVLFRRRR